MRGGLFGRATVLIRTTTGCFDLPKGGQQWFVSSYFYDSSGW